MAGPTDVDIANLALVDLGQPAISSFDDEGKAPRLMRAVYEATVKSVLRSHVWRCARKKVVLSPDPDAEPSFGFDNACLLPSDFIRVVRVNDHIDKFEVVGRHLQIDDDAPELTYVAYERGTTEGQFDPALVQAIASALCARLCFNLSDNATATQGYQKAAKEALDDAKFTDSMDGAPEDAPIGTWSEARLSEA